MVINLGGYVGSSTKREIDYAKSQGKRVDYFFPQIEQEVSRPYSMALPVDNAWTAVTVKVDRINGIYTKEVVY
jgi:hypothetical protein